jgi:hypothetical protein
MTVPASSASHDLDQRGRSTAKAARAALVPPAEQCWPPTAQTRCCLIAAARLAATARCPLPVRAACRLACPSSTLATMVEVMGATARDGDGLRPPHRFPGPLEGGVNRGDRATARCEDICNSSYRHKLCTSSYTMAVRDVDHGNVTEPAWPPYTSKLHPPHLTSV